MNFYLIDIFQHKLLVQGFLNEAGFFVYLHHYNCFIEMLMLKINKEKQITKSIGLVYYNYIRLSRRSFLERYVMMQMI